MKELNFNNRGLDRPFGDGVPEATQRAADFLLELGYEISNLSNEELVELAHQVAEENHDELDSYLLDLLFDDSGR